MHRFNKAADLLHGSLQVQVWVLLAVSEVDIRVVTLTKHHRLARMEPDDKGDDIALK